MSRFVIEPDSEFDGQAIVVELSDDPEVDGTVVGYATGGEAMDVAQEAADRLNETGHQPSLDGYTVAHGQEF